MVHVKALTWHDRLALMLERLPDERLFLLRDIVDALAERRRRALSVAYPDLESALAQCIPEPPPFRR